MDRNPAPVMDIWGALIDKIPFTVIGLLLVIIYGHLKMTSCKNALYRDGRSHVAEEIAKLRQLHATELAHLRELIEQKISDQKKLLKTQIAQNREALKQLKN
jgi:hypothetical protein